MPDVAQTKHIVISQIKAVLVQELSIDEKAEKIYFDIIMRIKDDLRDEYERLFFSADNIQ
jgi:hypothetical protein